MGAINILSKQVAELIAAGEVIERPASVIKELVENAIDAHSTAVTVEIKHGGVTFMRVSDNGSGIMQEDVRNAFLRHATSKIAAKDDLDSIGTLGFRGEALASICAVSRVELMTKHINEENGTSYCLEGGQETTFETIGCPQGTTFVVRDLFFNVPARMKFLKKDVAESNAIASLMDRIALSHPEIAFTFIRDGKQVMKTMGDGKLENAVFQVFGKQFYGTLIPVSYQHNHITVTGFVSKPVSSNRASRSMQVFFVNGRYVRTKTAMAALEQAYQGMIMTGKFPACVLNLEVDCSTLDVNVHPAKLEIRFTNERPVYECVYYAVKSAISQYDPRNSTEPAVDFVPTDPKVIGPAADKGTQLGFMYEKPSAKGNDEPQIFSPPSSSYGKSLSDSAAAADYYYTNQPVRNINLADYRREKEANRSSEVLDRAREKLLDAYSQSDDPPSTDTLPPESSDMEESAAVVPSPVLMEITASEVRSETAVNKNDSIKTEESVSDEQIVITDAEQRAGAAKYIGEAFSAYIIIEYSDDRLMFIDKHAAHERLLYEKLKRERDTSSAQMLIEPVTVVLDQNECSIVLENKEILQQAGFEVDSFGSGTIIIRSVPSLLGAMNAAEEFMEIADYLVKHRKVIFSEKMEWIYQNTACRAAIKAGNINHPEELIELAVTLEKNPDIKYCPHGRPVYFLMSKYEIEKNFKRL